MSGKVERMVVSTELMSSARVIHPFVRTVHLSTTGMLHFQQRHSQFGDVVVSKLATAQEIHMSMKAIQFCDFFLCLLVCALFWSSCSRADALTWLSYFILCSAILPPMPRLATSAFADFLLSTTFWCFINSSLLKSVFCFASFHSRSPPGMFAVFV